MVFLSLLATFSVAVSLMILQLVLSQDSWVSEYAHFSMIWQDSLRLTLLVLEFMRKRVLVAVRNE